MNDNSIKVITICFLITLISSSFVMDQGSSDSNVDLDDPDQNDIRISTRSTSSGNSDWPMFMYDRNHSGYNPYAVNDNPGKLRWRAKIRGNFGFSSPSIIDNHIYIGSQSSVVDDTQGLYCLYLNGTIKWFYPTNDSIKSSPISDRKRNIVFTCLDGNIYSLFPNGSLKWIFQTDAPIESSPTLGYDGKIYCGSFDGYLYCLHDNGTLKWKYHIVDPIYSTPAISVENVVYICVNYGNELYAFYQNGSLFWDFTAKGSVIGSSPSIGPDGTVYFGTSEHYIYAVYPNGTEKWNYRTGERIISTASIDSNGSVYIGSEDYYFYSVDQNGSLRWKFRTNKYIWGSAAVDGNGNIYFGSHDSNIYCLHQGGTLKWRYETGSRIHSSPAIDNNGNIFIGSGRYLYSIGSPMPNPPCNVQRRSGFRFIDIKWEDPDNFIETGVLGYRVYRNDSYGSYELVAELGKDQHHFNDTSVVNGVKYHYCLVAYNEAEDGKDFFLPPKAPMGRSLPPENVLTVPGPNSVNISWDPPLDSGGFPVLHYNVYRYSGSEYILIEKTNGTNFNDTSLDLRIEYQFKISAVTEFGEGIQSEEVAGIPLTVPTAPRNFTVIPNDGWVEIMWNAPRCDGGESIMYYRLYRNGEAIIDIQPDWIGFTDIGVDNGMVYTYRMSAVNGVGEGWFTANVTVKLNGTPRAPENFSIVLTHDGALLSWDPPSNNGGSNVREYRVYRSSWGGEFVGIFKLEEHMLLDNDVFMGATYTYYVAALNNIGEGNRSNEIEITIPLGMIPSVPENVNVELTENGIRISWDAPEDHEDYEIEGYRIHRKSGTNENFSDINTTSERSYTERTIQTNSTYYYSISAFNEYGESEITDPVSIFIPENTQIDPYGTNDQDQDGKDKNGLKVVVIIVILILVIITGVVAYILMKTKDVEEEKELASRGDGKQITSDPLESLSPPRIADKPPNDDHSNGLFPDQK